MSNHLKFRVNACPICLICLICKKIYGNGCECVPDEARNIKVDFRCKLIKDVENPKHGRKFDFEFVNWFQINVSPHLKIPDDVDSVNICRKCINKYDYFKRSKEVNLFA